MDPRKREHESASVNTYEAKCDNMAFRKIKTRCLKRNPPYFEILWDDENAANSLTTLPEMVCKTKRYEEVTFVYVAKLYLARLSPPFFLSGLFP